MDLTLVLPLLLVLVFGFFMVRRTRAQQKAMVEQQQKMHPGVEVMTSFGLFGRIVSLNSEESKVTLELSPGCTAMVHQQAIVKVIDPAADTTAPSAAGGAAPAAPIDPAAAPGTVAPPPQEREKPSEGQ